MVPADAASAAAAAGDLPSSLVQRADGVYFKAEAPAATLQAAAEALKRAGAQRVDAWVCARTP